MKIIGTSGSQYAPGYIVELSADEMANLVGYSFAYSFDQKGRKKPATGDTVNIAAMYKNLRELASTKTQFDQAKKILLAIADNLDLVEPVVLNITDQIDGPKQ